MKDFEYYPQILQIKNELSSRDIDAIDNFPKEIVHVFVTGLCKSNPGTGGWGYVIIFNNKVVDFDIGKLNFTAKNQVDLISIIIAIKSVIEKKLDNKDIILYTDSSRVVESLDSGRLFQWLENGWKTEDGARLPNRSLWRYFLNLYMSLDIDISLNEHTYYLDLGNKLAKFGEVLEGKGTIIEKREDF